MIWLSNWIVCQNTHSLPTLWTLIVTILNKVFKINEFKSKSIILNCSIKERNKNETITNLCSLVLNHHSKYLYFTINISTRKELYSWLINNCLSKKSSAQPLLNSLYFTKKSLLKGNSVLIQQILYFSI